MKPMQKVPLRLFYRTIDDLIINHQSDAAISRATYLLQEFPKNLAVYQLLGKAFLDKQEFGTANLIFEKILEIEPDDFVSHIGISLISESFGNLNKALESMWRAYELQPSNESLQNEVKRLQEATTGFTPEQVRLTRGTLIKMYSRSQLAEQTIAEARLGIQESPNRIDYKIHLAKMLYYSKNNIEAVETCMNLIRTLPYCYEALLILYRCLPSKTNSDDASIYKSTLSELDPYFTFMRPETNSVDDIPDIAVMVEDRNEPEKPIENLDEFIQSTWNKLSKDHLITGKSDQNQDWTSIIDNAISTNTIGNPIKDTSYEEVVFPEEIVAFPEEDYDELVTKKQPEKITAKEIMLRNLRSTGSKLSEINNDLSWIPEDKIPDEPIEIEERISKDSRSEGSLPTNFGDTGMIDDDSPIDPESKPNTPQKNNTLDWEVEHSKPEINDEHILSVLLDDTQKIKIFSDDPEKLILQAFDSLKEDDVLFSKQCFSKLIQKDYELLNIADRLENFCHENPEQLDLWLILVEIYKKLGLDEKTLSVLVKAQNSLSFR
ncbi:MAG: hypothetical protein MUP85_06490 [Candidatus Lokiarchaeota archaeon]|nr:hypothetical protein [Candidatus Lokiarchaeota archaeon]